jgi:hypothetical protein
METTAKRAALDHKERFDMFASLKRQHQHESDSYKRRCTLMKKNVETLTASLKSSEKFNADLAFDVKSLTTAVEETRNNSDSTGGDNSELLLQVSRQHPSTGGGCDSLVSATAFNTPGSIFKH